LDINMADDEEKALDFLKDTAKDAAKGLVEESEVYSIAENIVDNNKYLFGTVNSILNKELGISFDIGKDKEIGFMVSPDKASLGFKMSFSEGDIVDFANVASMSKDKIDNINALDWINYQIENAKSENKAKLRQLKEKLFGAEIELKKDKISRRKFTLVKKKEAGILSKVFTDQDITKLTLKDLNNRETISKIVEAAKSHQEYERATGKTGARKNKLVTWAVDEAGKIRAGAMKNFFSTLQSQVLSQAYGEQNEASSYKTAQKGKIYNANVLGGATFKSSPILTVNALQQAMVNVAASPDKIVMPNGNIVLNRDKIFTQLRLTTGIRVQDLMRLHKDDIKNGFVTITSLKSKSNTYETVDRPISKTTEKLLHSLINNPINERGFLFVNNFTRSEQGERLIMNASKNYTTAGNNLMNASADVNSGIRITDKGKERRLLNKDFRKYIATLAKKKLKADPELRKAIMGQVGEFAEKGMSVIDNYYILDELPKGTQITPEWKAAMEQLDNLVFSEIDMNDGDKAKFFSNVEDVKVETVIEGEEKPIKKQIKKIKKEAKPNIITDTNIEASKSNALHLSKTSSATAGTVVGVEPKVSASKKSISSRFGNKNKIKAGVALATAIGSTGLKAASLLTPTPIDVPITLGMIAYEDIKDPHEFEELYPEEHLSWTKGKELDKLDKNLASAHFVHPRMKVANKKRIKLLQEKRQNLEDELKRRGYDKNTALALGKNIKEDIFEEREEQMFDIKDPTVDPMISGLLQETKGYKETLTNQMSNLMNE